MNHVNVGIKEINHKISLLLIAAGYLTVAMLNIVLPQ